MTQEALEDFWNDVQQASQIQREKTFFQSRVEGYEKLQSLFEEFEVLVEYALTDKDESLAQEAIQIAQNFLDQFSQLEREVLLSGEADFNNAIVSINSGAGGTESCDWANMLLRMVSRWAENKGMKTSTLDSQGGDEAGIKSAVLLIEGAYAYGLLKGESGVHRLVRISPFDSNKRRHTSFASVFVSPEVDDSIEIDINDADLKIDVYRSGGAGGQSVNTTDSAVRITHKPTGIVVTCQNERSQLQNKMQAMKVLRSRLFEMELEKRKKEEKALEENKKKIEWGSQIRSYILHPYKMVKDHRTLFETSQAQKVLDGDLDDFLDSVLQWMVDCSIDDLPKKPKK